MSYIQLVGSGDNPAQFTVNFSDVINIEANSKISLVDAAISKSLLYDFSHLTSLAWTIDWGELSIQGGSAVNYSIFTSAFTNKARVSHTELISVMSDKIANTPSYKNHKLDMNVTQELSGGARTTISVLPDYVNKPKEWDAGNFAGWDDSTSSVLTSTLGTTDPDGAYLNYALMTKPLALGQQLMASGGGSFEPEGNQKETAIIGLSFIDAGFTDTFFSKSATKSEFWNLSNVVFRDYAGAIDYQFIVGADLDTYTVKNVGTGATVFTSAVVGNIKSASAEITLTNAANPAGVVCKFAVGDNSLLTNGLTLTEGGTGYIAGNEYDINDANFGGDDAVLVVDTIGAGGNIVTFHMKNGGFDYERASELIVAGGATDAILTVNYLFDFAINCDNIAPAGFTMNWNPTNSVDRGPPTFLPSIVDIPVGVHFSYDPSHDITRYILYRHMEGETYSPYDRDNIELVDVGTCGENPAVYFSVGLNQEVGVSIYDDNGEVARHDITFDDLDDLPEKPAGSANTDGLKMCYFSDVKGTRVSSDYNYVARTFETLLWTRDDATDDFDDKPAIEVTIKFGADSLGSYLGFPENNVLLTTGNELERTGDSSKNVVSGPIDTGATESKRLNICIDNLTHQSYKNFSNDNMATGALNGGNGALSGTLNKMIGVFPPFLGIGNTYGRLYHSGFPVYLDLHNKSKIQINRLNVSIRDSETNKLATDLSGSTSLTIHIKK